MVGDIYDASLDPTLWPGVFDKASTFIGGSAAALSSYDIVAKQTHFYFSSGHEPHFLEQYTEKYAKINPVFPTVVFHDVERPLAIPDCLPQEEFCRSQFVREWVAPQGYVDTMFANLEKSPTGCALFTVMRHMRDGFADDAVRHRFGLVVPHVRRALLIGKVIELHKIEAAALADSLDTLASAMFIVDATGRIVHANASGFTMISEAKVVNAPNGRLRSIDPSADQSFQEIFPAAEAGDAALGRKGIAIPLRAGDGERHVAHVLPLTSGARRRAGVSYAAAAAVFVRKAGLDLPTPPEVLAREFALTPAELRVLFAIIQIGGAPEVASVLGIAEPTVKTHLKRLFEKTGTHRQADLVKLVAGFSNPLLN